MIHGYSFYMVVWNLFLALVPVFSAWRCTRLKPGFIFWLLVIIWFFFLPNTTYLFTLVRHLLDLCSDYNPILRVCRKESWVVIIFFTYALAGTPCFLFALRRMSVLLGRMYGEAVERWLPVGMIPLTALGTLFGLINRFNSWEVVTQPVVILRATLAYFTDPAMFKNFTVFTAFLFLIYYGWWFLIFHLCRE